MATEVFNVYADDSCSTDSFVMSAPLDVLVSVFKIHDRAQKRIEFETLDGKPCIYYEGRGVLPLGLSRVVIVKAARS